MKNAPLYRYIAWTGDDNGPVISSWLSPYARAEGLRDGQVLMWELGFRPFLHFEESPVPADKRPKHDSSGIAI